jgi:hypothetical protein
MYTGFVAEGSLPSYPLRAIVRAPAVIDDVTVKLDGMGSLPIHMFTCCIWWRDHGLFFYGLEAIVWC